MFKGKKIKKPSDLAKALRASLTAIDKTKIAKDAKEREKVGEELSRFVGAVKQVMFGDEEHEVNAEHVTQLIAEIVAQDVLPLLVPHLSVLEFEARKELALIFTHLMRRNEVVDYVASTGVATLSALVAGHQQPEGALTCGAMLREAARYESLVRSMLRVPEEHLYPFFVLVEQPNFDVASDAFSTFKEILTRHKALVAEFLESQYDKFFNEYARLLSSANYVTKRQSLKLLGELLLDRANFNVMTRYIAASTNLKLMMTLLRDKSRSIQFEAFHVFKVFVANPNKPQPILDILVKNKEKLISYLTDFHNDKDDEQFSDEKAYLLRQIESLL